MQLRWLKADEYETLAKIPDKADLSPENTLVAVAVQDEKIVGRMVLISLPHIECAWVAPEHRGGILAARLETFCEQRLASLGASKMLAIAVDEKIESYFKRRDYVRLGTVWMKEI
jgi:hypothetical protein